MKKLIFSIVIFTATAVNAQQDFKTEIATARTSYAAGNLEDAHFALQQAMQELDLIIGKEVLKLLPEKMNDLTANTQADNVTSNIGFIGATIHRDYGNEEKKATIEIISNSPLLGSLNALLNMPVIGGMMRDENSKTVKVQGYKARLERTDAGDGKYNYKLDVPFSSALLTFNAGESTETEVLNQANTIPLQEIAKLIQ